MLLQIARLSLSGVNEKVLPLDCPFDNLPATGRGLDPG